VGPIDTFTMITKQQNITKISKKKKLKLKLIATKAKADNDIFDQRKILPNNATIILVTHTPSLLL
jgi:ribosomal protein S8E